VVASVEALLSPVSARFYGHPSRAMSVVGVTGTSGKTTTTYMVEAIFRAAGLSSGVIGTVEYRWPGGHESAPNTTPMAGDVQRLLAAMRRDGVSRVAMEVSSHALSLGRVADVDFSVGVFLNLTPEHLDFHKDMDGYFAAKALLFDRLAASATAKGAAVNADDPAGERMRRRVKGRVWTFGTTASADVSANRVISDAAGSRFSLVTPVGTAEVALPLVGGYNVSNALAAASAALLLDIPIDVVGGALSSLHGVPGRLERVSAPGSDVTVLVDYAHKEDALRKVLLAVRPLTKGKLIVVFGCGGDRDRSKRPLMGETAVRLADRVIITSDNPRSEDPAKIALDVEVGARRAKGGSYDVVLDRAQAIERAIRSAAPGDVVLLAGKGHETYQIFKEVTVPFDDREVARRLLANP
jgi:UDP-N-acetylmuramoyl-L-alanyl-D-glutamate--2,6-diaminopimelate ligase